MSKSIVVAIDSYKGSATSKELNQAVSKGIKSVLADAEVVCFEISDGGEGTIDALYQHLGGEIIEVETVDLLGRAIQAPYLLSDKTAVIEVATVVGIDKITPSAETIQKGTSFGLAALFLDAKARGVQQILVSLGGSGTSDGGVGLLKGLGAAVDSLAQVDDIDFSQLQSFKGIDVIGMADVTNPYAGPKGFAQFFGKQKGGIAEILQQQDDQAWKVVEILKRKYDIDVQVVPGTGAAGGLGGALVCLGGRIESGFDTIARLIHIEEAIAQADLVITGEGQMDYQTENGKVPFGLARLAQKYGVDTIALCGALGEHLGKMDEILLSSFSIQQSALSLSEAMETDRTLKNIERLARMVTKTYFKSS